MVDDHPTVGCLQQRVVEKERKAATGPQNPSDLGKRRRHVIDVLEDETHHDSVDTAIGNRQGLTPRLRIRRPAGAVTPNLDLAPGRVEADRKSAACCHHRTSDLTFSRADIEHPLEAIGELERKRNDLFDIFGIDAVGELSLPPVGVIVPMRFTHRAKNA